jgi:hypothetical protein
VAVLARQIAAATPESAAEISAYPASNGLGSSSLRGATFNNRSAAGDKPNKPPSFASCAAAFSATAHRLA